MGQSGFMHNLRGAESSDEWFTPPELFDALGIDFDLDPAAPPGGVPWIPAARHFSKADDGLSQPWSGRVWCNPPYGRQTAKWLARLTEHGDGLALVFARTDTRWFHEFVPRSTAVCYLAGRLRFVRADGTRGDSAGAPSMLVAYGLPCALALAESGSDVPGPAAGRAIVNAPLTSFAKAVAGRLCPCVSARKMETYPPCVYATAAKRPQP